MICERNICYQQEYNGGCDTCPCNDEQQECKEENGQSMTDQEIVEQLKSLKSHCEDFRDDEGCVWDKDVEALDRAIEAVGKQDNEQWHWTSEEKPNSSKHCIYSYGNIGTGYGYYLKLKDKWYTDWKCIEEIYTPLLWRDMPDTPEEYLIGDTCG